MTLATEIDRIDSKLHYLRNQLQSPQLHPYKQAILLDMIEDYNQQKEAITMTHNIHIQALKGEIAHLEQRLLHPNLTLELKQELLDAYKYKVRLLTALEIRQRENTNHDTL